MTTTTMHACGGTILTGGSGEQSHSYCDGCRAFAFDALYTDEGRTHHERRDVPAGIDKEANRAAWDAGDEASPEPDPQKYTYTIFDGDPVSHSGCTWLSREGVEIAADSDAKASKAVALILASEAAGLNPSDGYDVGDRLYALVWDANGAIVATPTYDLTAEDLGVDDDENDADA